MKDNRRGLGFLIIWGSVLLAVFLVSLASAFIPYIPSDRIARSGVWVGSALWFAYLLTPIALFNGAKALKSYRVLLKTLAAMGGMALLLGGVTTNVFALPTALFGASYSHVSFGPVSKIRPWRGEYSSILRVVIGSGFLSRTSAFLPAASVHAAGLAQGLCFEARGKTLGVGWTLDKVTAVRCKN